MSQYGNGNEDSKIYALDESPIKNPDSGNCFDYLRIALNVFKSKPVQKKEHFDKIEKYILTK